jgi:hypothetical protein
MNNFFSQQNLAERIICNPIQSDNSATNYMQLKLIKVFMQVLLKTKVANNHM